MKAQNKYDAAMSQRASAKDALDDFPTPPWATRALAEYVIVPHGTCLEPACGRGHMSAALAEYFDKVISTDIFDYGFGSVADFLNSKYEADSFDWVITNPPFNLAEQFIIRSMKTARRGIAMLTRTVFIESVGRYDSLFNSIRLREWRNSWSGSQWSRDGSTARPALQQDTRGWCGKKTGSALAS